MTITRRTVLAGLGAIPAIGLLPRAAFAAFPDHPVHLIVPFAAGGNADIVGRLVGDVMGKALKQTVVVENRGGAGGGVGAQAVAKADPDGYTLLVASNGPMTINPLMHKNLGYDPEKDLAAVALSSYVPHALILSNKITAKTIPEFIEQSKKTPMTIATSGIGSASHMTLERFKAATGAHITHVPYRGGGAMMPDLISGTVNGAMTEFSTALQLHKGGKAHIAGIAATKRSKLAPDIPTFIEGGVKNFTAQSYIGIVAPAKTPPAIIAQLQKAIAAGLQPGSPAVTRLEGLGAEIATPEQMTSAGFAAFIKADFANMKEAAKLAGIEPK
ncbi:MAG: tripartite tricarboxylate transporter substrate binding protein [Rhodopseudomonas sp.]|nr:tripartite tricarboxylate transporter substrate binding protein [Rhodopseudomonas sp.]